MAVRRKTVLILTVCAVMASIGIHAQRPSRGGQRPGDRPGEGRGGDWSLVITPGGVFEISHEGAPIVHTAFHFWGKRWAYAGPSLRCDPDGPGRWDLSGQVPGLGLKLAGWLRSTASNAIRMEMLIRAEQEMSDVIGGGFQWDLNLNSPSLRGRAAGPELLPDNRGWTWRVGEGETITLRFDEPAARVYFERNQKRTIRTFLVGDRIPAGTRRIRMTLQLPEGASLRPSPEERYGGIDPGRWFRGALAPDAAPVDLSFLNRDDRPAGRRGFVRADGDRMVFADGSPARFWGGNLAAVALFATPRQEVPRQAHRMAQLGYNLMRIHQHDTFWADPNIFGRRGGTTRRLDPKSLDALDWWIKCLEDEGIYIWLDLHDYRTLTPADGVTEGAAEIARAKGNVKGFCYYNARIQELMKEFQHDYLNHKNRYTGLRYREDPAVVGVLITNEDDLTFHFGNLMLPDKNNPVHNALWTRGYTEFARAHGLPANRVAQTWLPGPSKLYLSQAEHEFNRIMIGDLRGIGVRAPIATTNFWGGESLFSVPVLTDGEWIDVHSYGEAEELGRNAHYQGNYLGFIAMAQVYGKPLAVTEWNVPFPAADRFTAPLAVASLACLQGWDAPMIYNYSQLALPSPRPEKWSTYNDPALTGLMPAAALLFRRGHVSPARKTYCFRPEPSALFGRELTPDTCATIRTLAEQSRLTIGIPEVPELPWLEPTRPSGDAIVVTDPDRDFLPPGQSFVRSDTGELTRDWEQGIQAIDTPRSQAVGGWIGGKTLKTRDASFAARTNKAVIALTSVDDRPLSESRFVLVTAVARAVSSGGGSPVFLSEPVHARITLRTRVTGLEVLALGREGRVSGRPPFERQGGALTFEIPAGGGTHWYVLKAPGGQGEGKGVGAGGGHPPGAGR